MAVHPPLRSGASRHRTTPPAWKRGTIVMHTSVRFSSKERATKVAPRARALRVRGTALCFPMLPDVCNRIAWSSGRVHLPPPPWAGLASGRPGPSNARPSAPPSAAVRPRSSTPAASATAAALNPSAAPRDGARSGWETMRALAPEDVKMPSTSPWAPLGSRGMQHALEDRQRTARPSSGPASRATATRSPGPMPNSERLNARIMVRRRPWLRRKSVP
mmetsp:Transcript_20499/g.65087  ORF Transcript_20499/g.65087 Transcript_20499/m.65087 type:complete len:218 (+) Transcript_20499:437-1090(+)